MTDAERQRIRNVFVSAGIPTIRTFPFVGPHGRGEKVIVVHPTEPRLRNDDDDHRAVGRGQNGPDKQ